MNIFEVTVYKNGKKKKIKDKSLLFLDID